MRGTGSDDSSRRSRAGGGSMEARFENRLDTRGDCDIDALLEFEVREVLFVRMLAALVDLLLLPSKWSDTGVEDSN